MIGVTLQFDSVQDMLDFFNKGVNSAPASAEHSPAVQAPGPKEPKAPKAPKDAAAPAAPQAVSYDDVAKAIQQCVVKDRAKTIEALGSLGAKRGPDLKPEQYGQALELLNALADSSLA